MAQGEMTAELTQGVRALMKRAAELAILPRYRQIQDIVLKAPGEMVTQADRESEAIIADGLARLLPEAAIVGEESSEHDPASLSGLGRPLCWIVDPLDGTGNFAAASGPFGILVALAADGLPVAGWILDPLTGRFCHAIKGQGAWIDGRRITARQPGVRPVLAISSLYRDQATRDALARRMRAEMTVAPMPRCAAEQYPRIALGEVELALFGRTLAWDHAAGVIFLNEAGGKAARPDGSAYRVDDFVPEMIAAASPALWDNLASVLPEAG